jgi:peptide/nickel transport system permease protein
MRTLSRAALGIVGAGLSITVTLIAIFAPYITSNSPNEISVMERLTPPSWTSEGSWEHPLGTDNLGRDLWTRIAFGARISLAVGLISVALSACIGIVAGLFAGYRGGWIDQVIVRIADIQQAFPFLLLAIFIVAVLSSSIRNLVLVLAISGWVAYARLARAVALSIREREYVTAAKVGGSSTPRILFRHVLPNAFPVLMVLLTYQTGQVILAESSLSYLGLGVPPPTPSWGSIIAEGREYIDVAWWIPTLPGICLTLTIVGLGFVGDWLRDHTDPTLRQRG